MSDKNKSNHQAKRPFTKYGNFGSDIIRIEARSSNQPKPLNKQCQSCGETINVEDIVNEVHNKGTKVAYFIQLNKNSFGAVINETIEIIKLIYRGHYKLKRRTYWKHKGHAKTYVKKPR